MSSLLKKIAASCQLSYDPVRESAYGAYRTENVVVRHDGGTNKLLFSWTLCPTGAATAQQMSDHVLALDQAHKKVQRASYSDNHLVIEMQGNTTAGKTMENARMVLDDISDFAQQHGFVNCCAQCGATANLGTYGIGGACVQCCESCFANVVQHQNATKLAQQPKKTNAFTGSVGALLGSLIGVALWVVIYRMGYIAGLAALVMVVCAFKGYELLGGTLDVKGAIISTMLCLVMVYIAHNVAVSLEVLSALKEEYTNVSFFDAYRFVMALLGEPTAGEFHALYYKDLIIGYILAAVAIIPSCWQKIKSHKVAAAAPQKLQ
nr:hypothetical protein [Maliibacterium massiliense]